MDRTTYLERMQTALYHIAHGGLQEGDIVTCDGIRYYPYRYTLGCDGDGRWMHTAVLHDLCAESIRECRLEDVE